MSRVLVTGGAGFIGAQFIRTWLAAHPKDEIVNLDRLTYAGSTARLEGLGARHTLIRGDVCDRAAVRKALEGCTLAVHFAAETHVDRSITDSAPFLRTNVEGAYTLLDEARRARLARLVHVSTDEVYGEIREGAVDEDAPLRPRSPYAASKAAGDLLAQAFRETHGLPVVVARPTNIFGPWQFPEKFIPGCVTHALQGRPVPVYGDGQQRRAWLFVDDCCEALRLIAEAPDPDPVYNVAGGTETANLALAQQILDQLAVRRSLLQMVSDRPAHDRRYAMTDARLRRLGWQPATPFAEALTRTVAWYRQHEAWWRPLAEQLREDPYHWLNRPAGAGADAPARSVA
jgi:dTDP-glucose 4,6-dehydratase